MFDTQIDPTEADRRVLAAHDAALLDVIATRLAERHPADGLERFWTSGPLQGAHGGVLGATMLWVQHTGEAAALWGVAAWLLLVVALPIVLWGRWPHRPRWAHPRALLLPSEVTTLEDVLDRTLARTGTSVPRPLAAVDARRPVITGDDFHRCWVRSQDWRHRRLGRG